MQNLKPKKLPYEIFLIKRSLPPCENCWHYPGSSLFKNESIKACISRVAKNELGMDCRNFDIQSRIISENIDIDFRGHVIDIIYTCVLKNPILFASTTENKELRFLGKLPDNIGFNYRETLHELRYA
jgi:ADP-ribose pyrophosphatase YjhB (NUDIX family)